MVSIKSKREIQIMKEAGRILALAFKEVSTYLRPGLSTLDVSNFVEKIIRDHQGEPTFLNYQGFAGAICTSINEELIHGIPSKTRILKEGDILSVDVGVTYQGYIVDACRTYPIGTVSKEALDLIKVTEESFFKGCECIKEGVHLGDVSNAIQTHAEAHGYSLIKEYAGHGVGRNLHEDPLIPNIGQKGTGIILKEGMTLAIEPMVAMGKPSTKVGKDGWIVRMKDGKLSSHYENTVVVTKDGYEILTMEE